MQFCLHEIRPHVRCFFFIFISSLRSSDEKMRMKSRPENSLLQLFVFLIHRPGMDNKWQFDVKYSARVLVQNERKCPRNKSRVKLWSSSADSSEELNCRVLIYVLARKLSEKSIKKMQHCFGFIVIIKESLFFHFYAFQFDKKEKFSSFIYYNLK